MITFSTHHPCTCLRLYMPRPYRQPPTASSRAKAPAVLSELDSLEGHSACQTFVGPVVQLLVGTCGCSLRMPCMIVRNKPTFRLLPFALLWFPLGCHVPPLRGCARVPSLKVVRHGLRIQKREKLVLEVGRDSMPAGAQQRRWVEEGADDRRVNGAFTGRLDRAGYQTLYPSRLSSLSSWGRACWKAWRAWESRQLVVVVPASDVPCRRQGRGTGLWPNRGHQAQLSQLTLHLCERGLGAFFSLQAITGPRSHHH